ncbi:MAG TPA: hypothetical protein VFE24_03985, partial [Pirellulales bacterium]|nr:hypothetical protein [Pirellulales bacterium]
DLVEHVTSYAASGSVVNQGIPRTQYLILDVAARARDDRRRASFARVVVPGMPPHITQCGNRRQQTFFKPMTMPAIGI